MPKRQQLIANLVRNLVAQERSGHLEQSGCSGAIWSPIRSPEHLVVVDAFSLSIRKTCHSRVPHFKSNSVIITVSLLSITDDDPRILKLDDEFDVDEEA